MNSHAKVEEHSKNSVSFSFWRVWNWDTLLVFCFTAKWSFIFFSPLGVFLLCFRPSQPSKLTFVISWIEHSKQNSTSRRNGSKDQTVNQRFFTTKPEMNKVSKKENFTWGKNEIIFQTTTTCFLGYQNRNCNHYGPWTWNLKVGSDKKRGAMRSNLLKTGSCLTALPYVKSVMSRPDWTFNAKERGQLFCTKSLVRWKLWGWCKSDPWFPVLQVSRNKIKLKMACVTDLLSHGPDANIICRNLNDG